MPLEAALRVLHSEAMQVPLQPGADLVCNCRAAHRATVSASGTAPPLPATCSGSFWSLPLRAGGSVRIYGLPASAGVITPSGTRCTYLT